MIGIYSQASPTGKAFQVDTGGTLTTGLVNYWKMEDTTDYYGSNNGTGTNMTFSAGKVNNCGVFNGSSSKIQFTKSLNGQPSASINFWLKASLPSKIEEIIGEWDTTGDTSIFAFDYISSFPAGRRMRLGCSGTDATGRIQQYNESAFFDGTWKMITIVFIGSTSLDVYVNNVLQTPIISSGSIPASIYNSATGFFMMGNGGTSGRFFTGSIDETGNWTKALSSQELIDLYNSGNGQTMI